MAKESRGGAVLTQDDLDYSGMTAVGRIEIYRDPRPQGRGVSVIVHGFEFSDDVSCRAHAARAMAWARDVLTAEVEAARLAPGGAITMAVGDSQADSLAARDCS